MNVAPTAISRPSAAALFAVRPKGSAASISLPAISAQSLAGFLSLLNGLLDPEPGRGAVNTGGAGDRPAQQSSALAQVKTRVPARPIGTGSEQCGNSSLSFLSGQADPSNIANEISAAPFQTRLPTSLAPPHPTSTWGLVPTGIAARGSTPISTPLASGPDLAFALHIAWQPTGPNNGASNEDGAHSASDAAATVLIPAFPAALQSPAEQPSSSSESGTGTPGIAVDGSEVTGRDVMRPSTAIPALDRTTTSWPAIHDSAALGTSLTGAASRSSASSKASGPSKPSGTSKPSGISTDVSTFSYALTRIPGETSERSTPALRFGQQNKQQSEAQSPSAGPGDPSQPELGADPIPSYRPLAEHNSGNRHHGCGRSGSGSE